MNNAQIKQGIQFMTNFYEKFEFHKDLAVVSLSEYDQSLITNDYISLHDQVNNALKVSRYLSTKGFLIFLTIQQHLEKAHKETFVFSKYQKNGEKNKSPILVNILYDKLTKDRFSESVKHRIESLNFMEKAFS